MRKVVNDISIPLDYSVVNDNFVSNNGSRFIITLVKQGRNQFLVSYKCVSYMLAKEIYNAYLHNPGYISGIFDVNF